MQVQVQEYRIGLEYDPYWRRHIEAAVKAGYPRSLVVSGCIKADQERSAKRGYA